jgi:hypothetical protein
MRTLMVPAAARSASSCTRRIASPVRDDAGAASAIGTPSSRSVSGRIRSACAARRWTISTDDPIWMVSPMVMRTRSPGLMTRSLTRVPFTLPTSSRNIASPTCRQACVRDASGSSMRTVLVSPRPMVSAPVAGRSYVA